MNTIKNTLITLICLLTLTHTAHAVTFYVNDITDSVDTLPGDGLCVSTTGLCTLRAAVMEANFTPGQDRIVLGAGTYTLSLTGMGEDAAITGDLDITDSLAIISCDVSDGRECNSGDVIIDGLLQDRIFHVIGSSTRLIISDITLTQGSESRGGAVYNQGRFICRDSQIENSQASDDGGAIYNEYSGIVSISDGSILTNNTATVYGGSIQNDGVLVVSASEISNSASGTNGGAINNFGTANIINSSTINNNQSDYNAGAIYNSGVLRINDSTVSQSSTYYAGGAIYNFGDELHITNSSFTENTAENSSGGAIYANYSEITIDNSLFENNTASSNGGALSTFESTSTITDTEFNLNTAESTGGGVSISSGEITSIDNVYDQNVAEFGGGALSISDSEALISQNSLTQNLTSYFGGAIYITSSTVGLSDSTLSHNEALESGGAIYALDVDSAKSISVTDISITNSTISTNTSAGVDGGSGAIVLWGTIEEFKIASSTIVNNTSGSSLEFGALQLRLDPLVSTGDYGLVEIKNTILANNIDSAGAPADCYTDSGSVSSAGYNLIGDIYGCDYLDSTGDILGDSATKKGIVDPLLEALADNGGNTETHLPSSLSQVIDAAHPLGCTTPSGGVLSYDQRGVGYDRLVDSDGDGTPRCDIGAVEY